MDSIEWVRVNREDGETVGWLEPLDAAYGSLRPRDVLGHVAGPDGDWEATESLLNERGLAFLTQEWVLDGGEERLSILEVSPLGIVVSSALRAKALLPAERITLPWPDESGRLAAAPPR